MLSVYLKWETEKSLTTTQQSDCYLYRFMCVYNYSSTHEPTYIYMEITAELQGT